MNQQEMLPPWENQQSRQYNTDPREQPTAREGQQQTFYETDYSGAEPGMEWMSDMGEKLRSPRSQITPAWQWIIGAIIIFALASAAWSLINFIFSSIFLVLGLVATAIAISLFFVKTITAPPRTFLLDGRATLMLRNPAGSIHIQRGLTNNITITETKHINGWFTGFAEETLDYMQEGNTVRVLPKSQYKWSPLGGVRNVNLDITVPEHADIQTRGDAGSIRIEGISGQIKAETSAGTIHVEQATLEGSSSLRTSAGSIHVEQATLEGSSSLRTSAGTIHAQQTTLKGRVDFHTDAGTVHFEGELDSQGYYRFDTSMGSVDVILPRDSSFTLAASTDLGSVTNQFGSTTVGPAPHAHLELKSNLGSVTVHRR